MLACALLFAGGCGDSGGGDDVSSESSDSSDDQPDAGDGLGMGSCIGVCGTMDCGICPPAATMVDGGGFQIDATEVSNEQYAAMLDVDFDMSVLPAGCEWKSGFEPEGWAEDLDGALPVVGVDWCDAAVFCAWAGKVLCGDVGGGPANWDTAEDAQNDAWYRACSNAGATAYPYGSDYDAAACNGDDAGLGSLAPVGTIATCEGGVAGLFDMSGNVWEWTNACEAAGGDGTTNCRRRGGSRFSDGDNLRCGVDSDRSRSDRDNAVGFRCCASAP